jgi:hypothetical protein
LKRGLIERDAQSAWLGVELEPAGDTFPDQAEAVLAFLRRERPELERLCAFPGLDECVLDFAVDFVEGASILSLHLPADLVERNIGLNVIRLATVLVACLLSATAFAQTRADVCTPDVYEAVKQHLQIDRFAPRRGDGIVIAAACRIWPHQPDSLLAAFAYDEGVEYEKRLIVLVLDAKTKRVISSFRDVIGEDAVIEVGEHSLALDTARYQLGEQARAFGVRFQSAARGASCGQGYWGNELTLFLPEGSTLRPVAGLNLSFTRWLVGCPATALDRALWEDAQLTVRVGTTRTNGLFDLIVTASIGVAAENVSPGRRKDRVERHTLRYDGKVYTRGKAVPWWLY